MRRFLSIVTVFVPVALLYMLGALEFVERLWMDTQFRLAEREAQSGIVLVDVDRKSLRSLDVWPWPRGYHATVVENLFQAGAERVALDVDFSSRSVAEEDAEFAAVLEAHRGRVVLPVFQQWQHTGPDSAYLTVVEPLPELKRHAILGSINVEPGPDGLARQYYNRAAFGDRLVPAFASALAGDPRPELGRFYIDFSVDQGTITRISYVDALTAQFDPDIVRGQRVIVGATAVELGDQIAVPIQVALAGPVLQAMAFESLTQGRALQRSGALLTLSVAFALVLLLGPWFEKAAWSWAIGVAAAGGFVGLALSATAQNLAPVMLDATPWALCFVGMYVHGLVTRVNQQAIGLLAQGVKIRRTESLMQHVVENSFDAIVTVCGRSVETFNHAAQRMFGYDAADVVGRRIEDFVQESEVSATSFLFESPTDSPVEAVARHSDGRRFPVELVVTSIETDDEPRLVAVLRDISERKAQQERLRHQATHDPLTNLPNRFLLRERIERSLSKAAGGSQTVAILLLDLDRFKEINDALGHRTGDLLLKQVAARLTAPLDDQATIARLGGDEFGVLVPSTTLEKALQVAWQLIEALRRPFEVEGFSLQIDTSLGITLSPDHGHDAEILMQRADVAMYVAKRKRASLAVYRPEFDFNSRRHLLLRGDLRDAIENSHLKLHYQPKVLALNDRIVGVEGLIRWHHPKHGNIPPDEFIGLAEHSGLIRPLTHWVLEQALRQAAAWRGAGFDLATSVNLSARNLLEEDLPHTLTRLLSTYRVLPEQLTLEITESVIMEDPERALKIVTRLQDLGVGISIDDFGTGYSSLGYLMRLPAKEMKIDKSFVMNMEQDPASATIVHSTIELAHNLGLMVVAEGVETESVWNVLKELGCDIGQGYYFGKPLPPEELEELVRRLDVPEPALAAVNVDPGVLATPIRR